MFFSPTTPMNPLLFFSVCQCSMFFVLCAFEVLFLFASVLRLLCMGHRIEAKLQF